MKARPENHIAFIVAIEIFMSKVVAMNSPRSMFLAATILGFFTITAQATEGWISYESPKDYDAALTMASKSNKKVLLDFTGSNWCFFCKKLKSEVFDQTDFKNFANKNLVLVEVDFPKPVLSAQINSQRERFRSQYNFEGYPTLVLLDAKGRVIRQQSGYPPGGGINWFIHWVNQ
ncbi:MAG: thioredoxin family protein [Proteobacteria bacterium]|jgi:thioredoxin-related protein|nr:thioredoxin family protein [Pseudomonadota bacterium]